MQIKTNRDTTFYPFYIFPLLYVVSIYQFPFSFSMSEDSAIASYLMYLPLLFGILNIIAAVKFCKPENRIMMFQAAILIKYALIPFFIIGGMFVGISFLFSFIPVPFMIFVGPMVALVGTIVGWLVLAFESPYAIAYLRLSANESLLSKSFMILHIVVQFFFTLDVIDIMYLSFKEHRWTKLTIVIIVLLAVAILLLLILIALAIAGILTTGT